VEQDDLVGGPLLDLDSHVHTYRFRMHSKPTQSIDALRRAITVGDERRHSMQDQQRRTVPSSQRERVVEHLIASLVDVHGAEDTRYRFQLRPSW
jgi:hypothetical protein